VLQVAFLEKLGPHPQDNTKEVGAKEKVYFRHNGDEKDSYWWIKLDTLTFNCDDPLANSKGGKRGYTFNRFL